MTRSKQTHNVTFTTLSILLKLLSIRSNRYGRVRLESIPGLSMDQASSLQTLESFNVSELKEESMGGQQAGDVEETVVYFNTDSGLALVDGNQVLSLVPMEEHTVLTTLSTAL